MKEIIYELYLRLRYAAYNVKWHVDHYKIGGCPACFDEWFNNEWKYKHDW